MGKELDDICTSCPYIDAVKRHKQQLGAIEEYTQWLKKEPRASYFFLFQLYTRIHNTFFSQKQQLPFTPGGTHCPEKSTNSLKVLPEVVVSSQKNC